LDSGVQLPMEQNPPYTSFYGGVLEWGNLACMNVQSIVPLL
jgi:hypothetical protein